MNNLKYYNDSLAYDFDMFMPRPAKNPQVKDNIVVMPKAAKKAASRKKAAVKSISSPIMFLLCALVILGGFCTNISMRLKINEVNEEINTIKSSIAELDSEMTVLEVEMQRRISFSNLELEAVELGMKKPSKENVNYIMVNEQNAAKTQNGEIVNE